mmetsp:Transcript_32100/g.77936  ORF Transcript_32100/g.77936 Transcript_32100/m.77936 type:complete len:215 (+) Transcript_32100:1115-1759(+)
MARATADLPNLPRHHSSRRSHTCCGRGGKYARRGRHASRRGGTYDACCRAVDPCRHGARHAVAWPSDGRGRWRPAGRGRRTCCCRSCWPRVWRLAASGRATRCQLARRRASWCRRWIPVHQRYPSGWGTDAVHGYAWDSYHGDTWDVVHGNAWDDVHGGAWGAIHGDAWDGVHGDARHVLHGDARKLGRRTSTRIRPPVLACGGATFPHPAGRW